MIAFAGDALICVFKNTVPEDRDGCKAKEIEDCCFRAMQCGCILREYRTEHLSTHIGISYGELKVGILGGYRDRWIFMLNGECVSELSSCVDEAKSGQLVVTKKCFHAAVQATYDMFEASGDANDVAASVKGTQLPHSADGNYIIHEVVDCVPSNVPDNVKGLLRTDSSDAAVIVEGRQESAKLKLAEEEVPTPGADMETGLIAATRDSGSNSAVPSMAGNRTFSKSLLQRHTSMRHMSKDELSLTAAAGAASAAPTATSFFPSSLSHAVQSINPTLSRSSSHSSQMLDPVASMYSPELLTPKSHSQREKEDSDQFSSIACFVPRSVLSAVYSETMDSIGELRKVTTMFLNLNSYSKSLHRDPITLQPFLLMAQEALHEAGGFLRQFLVDDKGCVLIAMWGTPAFTYANNCSRALYCAAAIHRRSKELDHTCSIGVTTGMVYCGIIGSPLRQDYVGIGNEVNLAARLMGKAKGKILVDYKTYQNLDSGTKDLMKLLDYELKLKGMAKPVVPYVYASEDKLPSMSAEVDEEESNETASKRISKGFNISVRDKRVIFDLIDFLGQNIFMNVEESSSGVERSSSGSGKGLAVHMRDEIFTTTNAPKYRTKALFIVGLPGTGKVTLTKHFSEVCVQRNLNCITIRGTAQMEGVPLGLVRELFYHIVGKSQFRTVSQQRQKLSNWVLLAFRKSKGNVNLFEMIECLAEFLGLNIMDEETVDDEGSPAVAKANELAKKGDINTEDMGLVAQSFPSAAAAGGAGTNQILGVDSPRYRRKLGEYAFVKVLGVLLGHVPTAIIIESAHFCDESSWNAFYRMQRESTVNMVLVFTMRSNGHLYQRHSPHLGAMKKKKPTNHAAGAAPSSSSSSGEHAYERLEWSALSSPIISEKADRESNEGSDKALSSPGGSGAGDAGTPSQQSLKHKENKESNSSDDDRRSKSNTPNGSIETSAPGSSGLGSWTKKLRNSKSTDEEESSSHGSARQKRQAEGSVQQSETGSAQELLSQKNHYDAADDDTNHRRSSYDDHDKEVDGESDKLFKNLPSESLSSSLDTSWRKPSHPPLSSASAPPGVNTVEPLSASSRQLLRPTSSQNSLCLSGSDDKSPTGPGINMGSRSASAVADKILEIEQRLSEKKKSAQVANAGESTHASPSIKQISAKVNGPGATVPATAAVVEFNASSSSAPAVGAISAAAAAAAAAATATTAAAAATTAADDGGGGGSSFDSPANLGTKTSAAAPATVDLNSARINFMRPLPPTPPVPFSSNASNSDRSSNSNGSPSKSKVPSLTVVTDAEETEHGGESGTTTLPSQSLTPPSSMAAATSSQGSTEGDRRQYSSPNGAFTSHTASSAEMWTRQSTTGSGDLANEFKSDSVTNDSPTGTITDGGSTVTGAKGTAAGQGEGTKRMSILAYFGRSRSNDSRKGNDESRKQSSPDAAAAGPAGAGAGAGARDATAETHSPRNGPPPSPKQQPSLAEMLAKEDELEEDDINENPLRDQHNVKFNLPPACLAIVNHVDTVIIGTKGMDSLSVAALLDHNRIQPTAHMVNLVLMASSGSAFWCREIVRFINEMGLEAMEKALESGDSLEIMITLRFEKLSQQEQMSLRYASVIGDEFKEKMLAALLPIKKDATITTSLNKQLQVLVEKGFIVCLEESHVLGESLYQFQNSLIQEQIYKSIPAT